MDGVVLGSKEAVEAHNEHIKVMQDLDWQLSVTQGNIKDFEKSIIDLASEYNIAVADIRKNTETKLEKVNGFWNGIWNTIKAGGSIVQGQIKTAIESADVIIDSEQNIADKTEELNKRISLVKERELKSQADKRNEDYKKQLEDEKKHREELLQIQRDYEEKLGAEYEARINAEIDARIEAEETLAAELAAIGQKQQDGFTAKIEEKLKAEEEYAKKRDDLIKEGAEYAAEQLGFMVASGKISARDFAKYMLDISLRALENTLTFAITEIWAKQLAGKGFAGIPAATILTALVKGVFAGLRSRINSFAEGTEYVNGPGTETSDSIQANLSKGERVIPAHINKQLAGISNKALPMVINAGMQTLRLEKIMNNVHESTSATAQYLSFGKNFWTDGKYNYIQDLNTGITKRMIIN